MFPAAGLALFGQAMVLCVAALQLSSQFAACAIPLLLPGCALLLCLSSCPHSQVLGALATHVLWEPSPALSRLPALKATHRLAAESDLPCGAGRSALKEQTATDLQEMLKLDGSSISQATLTVRRGRSLCTACAVRVCATLSVVATHADCHG